MPRAVTRTLIFASVLGVYLVAVWAGQHIRGNVRTFVGDEPRYVVYAEQIMLFLIRGPAHAPDVEATLYSGPGYPMFIAALFFLGANLSALKLANAILATLGCFFIFLSLRGFLRERPAILIAILTVLHPKLVWHSSMILTETYAFFLSAAFCYFVLKDSGRSGRFSWIIPGIILGQIILTKVLFAYVVALLIPLFVLLKRLRGNPGHDRNILIGVSALLMCVPFLAHTYNATGRAFYWLWSGGSNLYWMSTPYANEYGDWMGGSLEQLRQRADALEVDYVYENHREFFASLPEDLIEADQAFKSQALRNIMDHPGKFAFNVGANLLRIFVDHPNTRADDASRWMIWLDLVVGVPLLLATIVGPALAFRHAATIPPDHLLVLLTGFVFIAGLAPLASFGRMLIPVLPMLAVSLSWLFSFTLPKSRHRSPATR